VVVDTKRVRQAFAHEAIVIIEPDGDRRAIGAAITVALCGHWEHEPPCPLAPHHTATEAVGDEVAIRVLFAAEPADETEVRGRIDSALASSSQEGPDGVITRWRLRRAAPSPVRPDENDHAQRLIRT